MANTLIYGTATGSEAVAVMGQAVTGGANVYYSKVFQMKNGKPASMHVEMTGTPTGVFTLWYSNKLKPNMVQDLAAHDGDWVQDTAFTPINPAAGTTKFFIPIGNVVAKHTRLKYVNSASTGNLAAWVETSDGGS
jgi:hypothetical protein